ncbi:MAG: cobalamin biosynthesis protein CobD [Candidatus Omnitrophica bacterium]|nr:cobalamin biosynthesis protein CobD [Candidatus Omnitrophota bacterium]
MDLIFGDPEWFPHPVRGIGKLINFFERRLRPKGDKWKERLKGVLLFFAVVGIVVTIAHYFLWFFKQMNPVLGNLAFVYLGYTCLSIKDMRVKAEAVLAKLKTGATGEARRELSKIVGRDTENLNEEKIIKATVESIAEGASDGVIAPLFYLILGGPVLALSYKAINTLDSMVGYKNSKYIHFGWFSAKMDDIMNYIPARITAFLITVSSCVLGKGFKNAFKTMLRDGRKHPSPNSGMPEAAMAGALGIRLGGTSSYQGKISKKPYLGEEKRPTKPFCINEALTISFAASAFMLMLGVIFKWLI